MLVMFGKNRKGFEKMCQSTSVYQNMPVKILSGNLGRKFLIVMYPAGGKWQLIIWWNLYFGQKWLLFQTSFQWFQNTGPEVTSQKEMQQGKWQALYSKIFVYYQHDFQMSSRLCSCLFKNKIIKTDMIYLWYVFNKLPKFPGFSFSKCHSLHINNAKIDCVLTLNILLLEY